MRSRLPDNPVATAPQTFDDDAFAPFAGVHRAPDASGQRASNGAAHRVATVGLAEDRTRTSPQNSRSHGVLVKLGLVRGQRLTCTEVGAIGRGGRAIEDRLIVGATIGAGGQENHPGSTKSYLRFH